eukprot:TRINITY_DN73400_c0_g1_i1.p1 TRINITY_DN73400_c0_g1~~TRINITY_DN73400_c0_g1_i1.p1  ORF type:complete len:372 (-),score=-4.36 TRINITY_DN73400_c0_g1_i1:230-1270(-)
MASTSDWVPCDISRSEYLWCPYAALAFALLSILFWLLDHRMRFYRGRMLVVPNHELDLYSRLWCIYEIYTATVLEVPVVLAYSLAQAGVARSRNASCSSTQDGCRIRAEIEQSNYSFEDIDETISRVTSQARRSAIWISFVDGLWLGIITLANIQIPCTNSLSGHVEVLLMYMPGFIAAFLISVLGLYAFLARASNGRPTRSRVWCCVGALCLLGVCIRAGDIIAVKAQFGFMARGPFVLSIYVALGYAASGCLSRHPKFKTCFGYFVIVLGVVMSAALVFADYVVPSARMEQQGEQSQTHFYPSLVKSLTAVASMFGGPVYLCWSNAARWGFRPASHLMRRSIDS